MFEEVIAEAMQRLAPKDAVVIVALSGGADSVSLLLALHQLGYPLLAAHCNFHLRADESNKDTAFVRQLCARMGVKLEEVDFDTFAYAEAESCSIEMAARELRYTWFAELAATYKSSVVVLAHQQDDKAETALLNLMRGSGLRGLAGIPEERQDAAHFIRPMLDLSRQDVEEYLEQKGQDYCTDSTNTDTVYRRNFVRHRLIPLMEEVNPSVRLALSRTIDNLRGAELLLKDYLEGKRKEIVSSRGLRIAPIMESPSPKTLLYELLQPEGFTPEVVAEVIAGLGRQAGAVYYSPTHRLIRTREYLELDTLDRGLFSPVTFPPLSEGNSQVFIELPAGGKLCVELLPRADITTLMTDRSVALYDYDRLGALSLRMRKEGDRIYPFGMNGSKTVARYALDKKLTHREREELYLLSSDDVPIWIVGHLADRRYRVTPETKRVLRVSVFL